MAQPQIDVLDTPRAALGEGVRWDARAGRLVWVDIVAGVVHRHDPRAGTNERFEVGRPVGVALPSAGGGLMLATAWGFELLREDGTIAPVAAVEADDPSTRMNDGACDRRGRVWAGTMALDCRPGGGALYRLDLDGSVARVLDGTTISNGIAWSADEAVMYYVDSALGTIDAFDHDPETGALGRRRTLVRVPPREGLPDGMTIDAEGSLWVALWGGGAVRRYAPDGRLADTIALPATQVTSCTFGGDALDELFVASAAEGLDPAGEPLAGALFRCRPEVQGVLAPVCAVRAPASPR